ncbi:probable endonuclease 4 isoform X1 [Homarus americanus]|uniref:probable endonuclease 4 isoform X1 n=1 Tax=Homarus americanus TaxID=6706 RepID=UPI001C4376D1|nr:probable endonuclease 4 isoform X1 [Homarus americanus]
MSLDKTHIKEEGHDVKRGRASRRSRNGKVSERINYEEKLKDHEIKTEDEEVKETNGRKREKAVTESGSKEVNRKRTRRKTKSKEEETKEDINDEPQIKKKKKNNKITSVDKGNERKEKVKDIENKRKGTKQKHTGDGEITNEETKPNIEDELKQEPVKKNPPKKKQAKEKDDPVARPIKYESLGDGPAPIPSTGLKYMGCHVSGAGGIWNAFENAEKCKAKSFALFLRNQRQWVAKPLDNATIKKWHEASQNFPVHLILPHGSYIMNLGSPVPEILKKSRDMLLEELQRCEKLGIPHYNFHPGSTVGKISREECCRCIAESINLAHDQTKDVICVLENMSCQGFTIGGDLHELRLIIEHVKDRSRVGVCLDTCHAHAAGYDLSTEDGLNKFLDDFGKIIGWQFLRGIHMNDSKGESGDHKDRHENIGRGKIGIAGFQRIMNCEHFNDVPLILETPWTSNEGYGKEISKLEGLIKK